MSPEERMEKLRRLHVANSRRTAGAQVKRELGAVPQRDGLLLAARMLRDRDPRLEPMRIGGFLRGVYGIGASKVNLYCSAVSVTSADRRIRHLTDRQRDLLSGMLEERAEHVSDTFTYRGGHENNGGFRRAA